MSPSERVLGNNYRIEDISLRLVSLDKSTSLTFREMTAGCDTKLEF